VSARPAYASYLPRAYLDDPRGVFARLTELFEMLMAGSELPIVRPLSAHVVVDAVPPSIALAAAAEDVSYSPSERRLTFAGEMSPARRDALLALGVELTTGLSAYEAAIQTLFLASVEQSERVPGLEELLDDVVRYSDPQRAPGGRRPEPAERGFFDDSFLDYLAGWVALSLQSRWPEAKQRLLIQEMVPLYKRRGTLGGIRRFLEIFVEAKVEVSEELGLQVGVRSTVERDTTVGGLPHEFRVTIPYGFRDSADTTPRPFDFQFLSRTAANTVEILDAERPAHTDYRVGYQFPGFVVGRYSTVQWDTLLWPHGDTIDIPRPTS
jgi:phage tail-like protein